MTRQEVANSGTQKKQSPNHFHYACRQSTIVLGTYLGAVLARILAQLTVIEGPMAQQRRPIAEGLCTDTTTEGVLRVLVHADQMLVEPANGKRRDALD